MRYVFMRYNIIIYNIAPAQQIACTYIANKLAERAACNRI